MRNPNLDYKAGLTDLWSIYILEEDQKTYIGEGDRALVDFLTEHTPHVVRAEPSRSVMRFSDNDVVGIGEPQA